MTPEQKKQYAAQLIGTTALPPELASIRQASREARAYHALRPYPEFWFWDWKTEDRGPLPRCMPIARAIVKRGARWLFGKPLAITVPGNETLEEEIQRAWRTNRMPAKMVALAESAALDGGYVLKFAYDDTAITRGGARKKPAIRFQTLSIVDQVRLYFDPHDCDDLLMARVQYSYYDAAQACTMWYREEWTAESEIHYLPVKAQDMGTVGNPDTYTGWTRSPESGENQFGVIPLLPIKNIETADAWGVGDLWDLFRVLDRVHLTRHLMDRSNQFDSEINPVLIDLEPDDEDIDKFLQPGQAQVLKSTEQGKSGQYLMPESRGSLRPSMRDYVKDLVSEIRSAVGSVEPDQSEITNVGNMTVAVLRQVYQAQIEVTDEKRKSQGDNGIATFLALVARGLQNAGVPLGVNEADEDTYKVVVKFADYFELSEDEKTIKVGRLQEEQLAGYVTADRAIEEVAALEDREDVANLKDEIAKEPKPSPTEADPAMVTPPTVKDSIRV
jgi:hypothetical protein